MVCFNVISGTLGNKGEHHSHANMTAWWPFCSRRSSNERGKYQNNGLVTGALFFSPHLVKSIQVLFVPLSEPKTPASCPNKILDLTTPTLFARFSVDWWLTRKIWRFRMPVPVDNVSFPWNVFSQFFNFLEYGSPWRLIPYYCSCCFHRWR